MTKREQAQLHRAIKRYGDANFDCGEWDRNESDEAYDTVWNRAIKVEQRLRKLIGLPEETPDVPRDESSPPKED